MYLQDIDIKYIDPTYMIRAIPTTTNDRIYCKVLGQGAVHGAFAGFTGCTVGLVNTHYVYLPIPVIIQVAHLPTSGLSRLLGAGLLQQLSHLLGFSGLSRKLDLLIVKMLCLKSVVTSQLCNVVLNGANRYLVLQGSTGHVACPCP